MKKTISIISILTVVAVLACSIALCFVGCNAKTTNVEQEVKPKVEPVFAVTVMKDAGIYFSSGEG